MPQATSNGNICLFGKIVFVVMTSDINFMCGPILQLFVLLPLCVVSQPFNRKIAKMVPCEVMSWKLTDVNHSWFLLMISEHLAIRYVNNKILFKLFFGPTFSGTLSISLGKNHKYHKQAIISDMILSDITFQVVGPTIYFTSITSK